MDGEVPEEAEDEEEEDAWLTVEERAAEVRSATRRHEELWTEVRACLQERDGWNSKLRALHKDAMQSTSLEAQIEGRALRGAAALTKSREYLSAGRAYAATQRRSKRLDAHLFRLLREIRDLEQDPRVVIDPANRLDEAMREAVMQDDPSKVQALLESLPAKVSSREVDQIIQDRGELAIQDLRSRIAECRTALAARERQQVQEARASSAAIAATGASAAGGSAGGGAAERSSPGTTAGAAATTVADARAPPAPA